jgi:acyl carrier protein
MPHAERLTAYNLDRSTAMTDPSTARRVKELIVRRLKLEIEPATIEDDAPLFGEGLGLDSIDALELVLGLEQEFGIKVEDEEVGVKAFASVNALVDFIEQKKIA